jgi:NDP-sugar pyrophosphorylase family protein
MNRLPVLMLAGGMGTRLASISSSKPKVLAPVLGRPFLSWKLENLACQGVEDVYLILGKGSEQVDEFIQESTTPIRIHRFYDGQTRLGTAGAIRKHLPNIPDEFILTYGDNLLDLDLSSLTNSYISNRMATMVCTKKIWPQENYNIRLAGGTITKYDKVNNSECNYADYGYSILHKRNFNQLKLNCFVDLDEVIQELIANERLLGFPVELNYYEIGTPWGLTNTENWLRSLQK